MPPPSRSTSDTMFKWLFGKKDEDAAASSGGTAEIVVVTRKVKATRAEAFASFVDKLGTWWPRDLTWGDAEAMPPATVAYSHVPGGPSRSGERPFGGRPRPPLLGQHNDEVLAELDYSTEEIAALHQRRAV